MNRIFDRVYVRALQGRSEAELSFAKGDKMDVHENNDEHWYRGALGNGTIGAIPITYTRVKESKKDKVGFSY